MDPQSGGHLVPTCEANAKNGCQSERFDRVTQIDVMVELARRASNSDDMIASLYRSIWTPIASQTKFKHNCRKEKSASLLIAERQGEAEGGAHCDPSRSKVAGIDAGALNTRIFAERSPVAKRYAPWPSAIGQPFNPLTRL